MRLSLKGLFNLCVMSSAYLCQGVLLDVDTYHGVTPQYKSKMHARSCADDKVTTFERLTSHDVGDNMMLSALDVAAVTFPTTMFNFYQILYDIFISKTPTSGASLGL